MKRVKIHDHIDLDDICKDIRCNNCLIIKECMYLSSETSITSILDDILRFLKFKER